MPMTHRCLLVGLCACAAIGAFSFSFASLPPPASRIATFSATDYKFDGPDSLPAGETVVRLKNRGKDLHQLQFLKLDEGKSPADLAAALKTGDHGVPSWAKHMGGPNGVGAGQSAEATLYLEPGSYVIICGVPGQDHKRHAELGMQKALRVTDTKPPPPEFRGNFHMAMFEYEFVIVQPLRKGRHTFYVINRGNQVHQVSLVRLKSGASADDVLTALEEDTRSRLPGTLIGGMSGLEPGRDGTFAADLTPGRYTIMCLFSNAHAAESHAAKGMVMNFTIE